MFQTTIALLAIGGLAWAYYQKNRAMKAGYDEARKHGSRHCCSNRMITSKRSMK